LSSRVGDLCRLLGFGTIFVLMAWATSGLTDRQHESAWPVWILDGIVALLIGNVVKEFAFYLCARVVNSFGRNFYRKGVMLDGKTFNEVFRSDGTWRRCEFGMRETVCEWTDAFGACHKSVSAQGPKSRGAFKTTRSG
jgi:hypothetical protein